MRREGAGNIEARGGHVETGVGQEIEGIALGAYNCNFFLNCM